MWPGADDSESRRADSLDLLVTQAKNENKVEFQNDLFLENIILVTLRNQFKSCIIFTEVKKKLAN